MSRVNFSPIGGPAHQLKAMENRRTTLAHVTPKLAAPPMHTEPGKHLLIFLQHLAVESDRTKRAQLVAGAITAAHAMDEAARVATERIDQIKAVGQFLIDQGLETVFLDGAPDIVLDMLTEPEETDEN